MPKFILIDQSLCSVGGHHYEYAAHMLEDAARRGYSPVLVSHRRFRRPSGLPDGCRVLPLFRDTTYSGDSLALTSFGKSVKHDALGAPAAGWIARARHWGRQQWFRRWSTRFRNSCAQLLNTVDLRPGDEVFFATLSEFDLLCLTEFLRTAPTTELATWHLQFHFNFLDGREQDYAAQQPRTDAMQHRLQQAVDRVPRHHLRFYCTTNEVAVQYNRAGVVKFEVLDYPVNESLRPRDHEGSHDQPLQVVCAGNLRREKGRRFLRSLVTSLGSSLSDSRKLQFLIQGSKSKIRRAIPARTELGEYGSSNSQGSQIVRVPFPLAKEKYLDLIRDADIGLFLYDPIRYYTRCSGILVEMLCAGVPVIVPAGCWLAEQVAEPIQGYLESLADNLSGAVTRDFGKLAGHDGSGRMVFADVSPGSRFGIVRYEATADAEDRTYVRCDINQFDRAGRSLCQSASVLRLRPEGRPNFVPVHLNANASRMEIAFRNAYEQRNIDLDRVRLILGDGEATPALGAVALIAADEQQVPALLQDLVEHHAHYRRSAREFSHQWSGLHNATHAMGKLLANSAIPTSSKAAKQVA